LEHGIKFNIITGYGVSGATRSNLSIIIVDKDIFSNTTRIRSSSSSESTDFSRLASNQKLSSVPNPTFGTTSFTFILDRTQKVSLEVIEALSGTTVARKLDEQYLMEGEHQYEFDLQMFPAGIYYLMLKTEQTIKSIRVIKLE